jgi:hypothetical protein
MVAVGNGGCVVITRVTGKLSVAGAVALLLSVTVTEKLKSRAVAGGVPESAPVALVNVNHDGRFLLDHE